MCTEGFYHRFCAIPVKCRDVKCFADANETIIDDYAVPASLTSSTDPTMKCSTKSSQCGCVKGFKKDANGKCVCEKRMENNPALKTKCSIVGTHTVATTAARCMVGSSGSAFEFDVENQIDSEPWLKNVPCPCRYGYAGPTCESDATYFVFNLLGPNGEKIADSVFGSSPEVRYSQTKSMLQSSQNSGNISGSAGQQLYMSLYKWDAETQAATVQVWFQVPTTTSSFSLTSESSQFTPKLSHKRHLYNRLLLSTQNAVKELIVLEQKQQFQQLQAVMSPLAALDDLYDIWNQASQSGNQPVTVVLGQQTSQPQPNYDPRRSRSEYASLHPDLCTTPVSNYDDMYGQEMNQDKNQTDHQNDLS